MYVNQRKTTFVVSCSKTLCSDSPFYVHSFSHATPEQIEGFCEKITKMKNENTLKAFFEECERERLSFGQTTTIFARK